MEIVWLGHSSLRVQSHDVTLITDPYANTLGFSMAHHRAEIVTVSNDHPHHSQFDAVDGGPRVLSGPGEYEIANTYISGMGTPGDEEEGVRRINTVFTIHAEGLTLCHLGDLNQRLSSSQVEELKKTDVLFVPAGGMCTISVPRVVELVNLIAPSIVIPLHYWVDGVKVELEPLDGFLGELGVSEVNPQARLNVTATNLTRELKVVVLQRAG